MEILYVAAYHMKQKNQFSQWGILWNMQTHVICWFKMKKTNPTSPPSHQAFINGTTLKWLKYSNAIFSWDIITTM